MLWGGKPWAVYSQQTSLGNIQKVILRDKIRFFSKWKVKETYGRIVVEHCAGPGKILVIFGDQHV